MKHTLHHIITGLSENTNHLYYYGSTAILKYKKQNIELYKILTDLNITQIVPLVKNIQFCPGLASHCYFVTEDQKIILIRTIDSSITVKEDSQINFLKETQLTDNMLHFFYHPGLKKYLTTGNFYSLRKNTISSADLREMDIEDILDLTYLIGTLSVYPDYIIFCEDQVDLNFKDCQFLLEKCFCSNNPYLVLKFLDEIKLLPRIFPFLYQLKGIEQDRLLHPEGDVFDHTLNCFQFIKAPSLELFYGLLLHDYGKSDQKQKNFSQHSTLGSNMVKKLLKPYAYSDDFVQKVEYLVEHHMVNSFFYRIDGQHQLAIFNQPIARDLMRLYKADTLGSIGKLDHYLDILSKLKKNKRIKTF
ncbi:MAG: HD domain-containing protein [Spirochaetes bacterium]|nr:HD domain-containing protein [Spirochaetota bacterium]